MDDKRFEPSEHPALMKHFERVGFDPYASTAPVQVYPPSSAVVAQRYRAFIERESVRLGRDWPAYSALADQTTAELCDSASFPAPRT